MGTWSYRDYVSRDPQFMRAYEEYHQKYATTMRESDRALMALLAPRLTSPGTHPCLLDIGCAGGTLLIHLRRAFPHVELHGGDLAAEVLEKNRRNPELEGISFHTLDLLALPPRPAYDVVVANAVLFSLGPEEFARAAAGVAGALRPGGAFVAFDWFHPFEQELTISERSRDYPQGVQFHARGYAATQAVLTRAGFRNAVFHPFYVPLDLPRDPASLNTHTVRTDGGDRLSFRGALLQPWCHLVADR